MYRQLLRGAPLTKEMILIKFVAYTSRANAMKVMKLAGRYISRYYK